MRRIVVLLAAWLAPGLPASAGDGSWTQLDAWKGGVQWVTTVERGRWQLGSSAGRDDGEWWARGSVMRTWTAGPDRAPWKLRAGLAFKAEQIRPRERQDHAHASCLSEGADRCAAWDAGLQIEADRWAEYGGWGTFLMGQWTDIDNAALAVAGLTHKASGIGAQLSLWHEDGGKVTPTIMLSAPAGKRLSLRAGHKFVEDETFVGFSFSTY
ncbi:hypothetical protein [Paracoccus contaminans]|nr:hypothetical protein [Paracoccus contaminans]